MGVWTHTRIPVHARSPFLCAQLGNRDPVCITQDEPLHSSKPNLLIVFSFLLEATWNLLQNFNPRLTSLRPVDGFAQMDQY